MKMSGWGYVGVVNVNIIVCRKMFIEVRGADDLYMPQKVIVKGGTETHKMEELNSVSVYSSLPSPPPSPAPFQTMHHVSSRYTSHKPSVAISRS